MTLSDRSKAVTRQRISSDSQSPTHPPPGNSKFASLIKKNEIGKLENGA
jgi:hypothetical protein